MPHLVVDEEISLKILELNESETLFSLVDANRLYLREWLPWIDSNTTVEDSILFIKSAQYQHEQNLGFQCGIWYRKLLVGVIGFHSIDWLNRNVEIGYWLSAEFQGHGIATRACETLVDYAFYEYKLNRVQIRCATGNTRSFAIIERLGFAREGMSREAELLYDHYVDLYIYGMTANEWKARHGNQPKKLKWN